MLPKLFFAILLVSLFAVACDDGKVKKLNAEINQIHDVAMKDHAEMLHVGRSLKDFMISAMMTPEQNAAYIKAIESIDRADLDMSNWMTQYSVPEGKPKAEIVLYLESQKKGIAQNHQDILAATAGGKKLLGQ